MGYVLFHHTDHDKYGQYQVLSQPHLQTSNEKPLDIQYLSIPHWSKQKEVVTFLLWAMNIIISLLHHLKQKSSAEDLHVF